MCMRFGCNPQINFCHFFQSLNLVNFWLNFYQSIIDTGYLVNATPPTVLAWISFKLFRRFHQGLKMCMWFAVILRLIFVTYFAV